MLAEGFTTADTLATLLFVAVLVFLAVLVAGIRRVRGTHIIGEIPARTLSLVRVAGIPEYQSASTVRPLTIHASEYGNTLHLNGVTWRNIGKGQPMELYVRDRDIHLNQSVA